MRRVSGLYLSSARPPHAQLLFVLRNRICESSERQISKLSKLRFGVEIREHGLSNVKVTSRDHSFMILIHEIACASAWRNLQNDLFTFTATRPRPLLVYQKAYTGQ